MGLVAMALLSGCGAQVPATFDPAPPRLSLTDLRFDDLTHKDKVVVLVFGDSGTGSDDQYAVGRRMAEICEDAACDLALMLGDNFYQRGVRPQDDGRWDENFERKFEAPYRGLGPLTFWAVAGNHDWFGGRASVDTEIAYSLHSDRWRMPAYDYAIPGLPAWLRVYALDTVILDQGPNIGQLERAGRWLCGSSGWRILMGHHPVYSTGQHGGRTGTIDFMERALGPIIDRCDVQLYLAGHDHHQEHLSAEGFDQLIQGAAGRLRSLSGRKADSPARQRFGASRFGFATLAFTREAVDITFYGYPRDQAQVFSVIYEATLHAR